MTKDEMKEISEIMQGIVESNKPKETNADKRRRILAIKDRGARQQAIRENMDAFVDGMFVGGVKIENSEN